MKTIIVTGLSARSKRILLDGYKNSNRPVSGAISRLEELGFKVLRLTLPDYKLVTGIDLKLILDHTARTEFLNNPPELQELFNEKRRSFYEAQAPMSHHGVSNSDILEKLLNRKYEEISAQELRYLYALNYWEWERHYLRFDSPADLREKKIDFLFLENLISADNLSSFFEGVKPEEVWGDLSHYQLQLSRPDLNIVVNGSMYPREVDEKEINEYLPFFVNYPAANYVVLNLLLAKPHALAKNREEEAFKAVGGGIQSFLTVFSKKVLLKQ